MASISWTYPADALLALRAREESAAAPTGADMALEELELNYEIEGDRPPWRPLRAAAPHS
ncbi:hypothetical protein [Sphingosinicella sp. CPCC 101087]|uniref:hypothetical protein n=1 Tax=Sphingosinicella sp. CPCC 101087 TaxID=2497754 RepID=UPI00101B5CC1|nr:hypothetical protein [Sphingosinicella sp. CPCC 101087]